LAVSVNTFIVYCAFGKFLSGLLYFNRSAPPVTQTLKEERQWDGNDLSSSMPFRDAVSAVATSLRQLSAPDEEWYQNCLIFVGQSSA
jgi:hypothetical protein